MADKVKPLVVQEIDDTTVDEGWNDDVVADLLTQDYSKVSITTRDWTVETIVNQLRRGSIDLNPRFQRRNAWTDPRRSRLIESLVIGVPIPQIVLAEDPNRKNTFIAIDGKQRLLTIGGYFGVPGSEAYWDKRALNGLDTLTRLNGRTVEQLEEEFPDHFQALITAPIRTTVLGKIEQDDLLYDLFFRLNSGSVPLSTQELRHVLHRGPCSDFLFDATSNFIPLHKILNLDGPDNRFRDVETLLRLLSIEVHGTKYQGNLKRFLDASLDEFNSDWGKYEPVLKSLTASLNDSIETLINVMPVAGKKPRGQKFERAPNKALLEVQIYYMRRMMAKADQLADLQDRFVKFYQSSFEFQNSIGSTTKAPARVYTRFNRYRIFLNHAYDLKIEDIPVPEA